MIKRLLYCALVCLIPPVYADTATGAELDEYARYQGFFDFWWDDKGGRLLLRIEHLEQPFLYQSSLARGIGSNDIGADRGQLEATRVVQFQRSGPKILLL